MYVYGCVYVCDLLIFILHLQWFQQNMRSSTVDHQVAQAVETFWSEAVGSVEEKIATPVSHLKLSEVRLGKYAILVNMFATFHLESCSESVPERNVV